MKCEQYQENLVAFIEGVLDRQEADEIALHLKECSSCRAEADEHKQLHGRLVANGKVLAQTSLDDRVMDRILREQTIKIRKIATKKRYGKIGVGLAVAAAVVMALFTNWPGVANSTASAAEVLQQGIQALANLQSVYIKVNMRTSPHDNFELILVVHDFVPIEMWKQFSTPPLWRAEEPGRIVVMDGESTVCLSKPNHVHEYGFTSRFGAWIGTLMDVNEVLGRELFLAQKDGSQFELTQETGSDGAAKLVVSIEAKAQGDYTNDYLKNKSIYDADNLRVYRFDAETKLLEDLEIYFHTDEGDVLVLEIVEIEYNSAIDPALFTLAIPENVIRSKRPEILPDNERYAQMSPQQAAHAFFQACADEDWDEMLKFRPATAVAGWLKSNFGGLEIIDIGEPFKSGRYHGWFVPYEIKLKNGHIRKHNLALRSDNAAKRYVVDGGL